MTSSTSSQPRIVVLGSINMDLVIRCEHLPAPGETIIGKSCREVPGGKGANQAVAAARSGGQVAMIGRVGDDAFASRLVENLRREQVDVQCVMPVDDCPSGVAVVAVDDQGENSILVVPGANGKLPPEAVDEHADVIQRSDLLLMQLEVPLDTVRAAVAVAKQAGTRVILNPAPMPVSLPVELTRVDVLCPNRSEAASMTGKPIETIREACQAAEQIRAMGGSQVIITLGSEGAVVCDDAGTHAVAPFAVTAVDTTAAGDAFAGTLAVRLALGEPLTNAVRYASAAGALAATREGAQPGMPSGSEIEVLLDSDL